MVPDLLPTRLLKRRRRDEELPYVSVLLRQPTTWPWHLLLILSALVLAFAHTGIPASDANHWYRKYQLVIALTPAAALALRTLLALWLHERTSTWIPYLLLTLLAFLAAPPLLSHLVAF